MEEEFTPEELDECPECGGTVTHDPDCPVQFDPEEQGDFSGAGDIPGFANDR